MSSSNIVATLVIHSNGAVSVYYMNKEDCAAYRQFKLGEPYIRYQDNYRLRIVKAFSQWDSENQWRNFYDLQDMFDEFIVYGGVPEDSLLKYNPRPFAFCNQLILAPTLSSVSRANGSTHEQQ